MKRASNSYRLQLIKEIVTRSEQQEACIDPMASYIHQLLEERPSTFLEVEKNQRFAGNHFDEHAGGWISDQWGLK